MTKTLSKGHLPAEEVSVEAVKNHDLSRIAPFIMQANRNVHTLYMGACTVLIIEIWTESAI